MPNTGGPRSFKRRVISSVVTSIILYACPVWSAALSNETIKKKLSSVYRLSAIRQISGFRTISDDAALVLARTIPIDILADEMRRIYFRRLADPGQIATIKREERGVSICRWQSRWECSSKGRWTYYLLPIITTWLEAKHCEPNFYMTQFLSGHGCFRKYLHKFGHDRSPTCPNCVEEDEDARHVLFCCPRFRGPWELNTSPCQILNEVLGSETKWNECNRHISAVMQELRRLERQRSNESI